MQGTNGMTQHEMMSEVLVEFEIRSRGKHQGIKGGQGSWERVSFSLHSILLALLPSPSKSNAVVRNAPIVRSNVLDVEADGKFKQAEYMFEEEQNEITQWLVEAKDKAR